MPDSFADLCPQCPWHQRLGKLQAQVIQVIALLLANIERVAKALGDQHADTRPPPFDQRIRDQCRAVYDFGDVIDGKVIFLNDCRDPFQHSAGRIPWCRQPLVNCGRTIWSDQGKICKSSTNINTQACHNIPLKTV